MTAWIVLVAAGLITFGLRFAPVAVVGRVSVPVRVQRALDFMAPAMLAALAAPAVVNLSGGLDLADTVTRASAAGVAVAVAHRSASVPLTVATGLSVFWIADAVVTAIG